MPMSKLKINYKFATTPIDLINNKEISLAAKGLFGYIHSKPEGWEFSAEKIAIQNTEKPRIIGKHLQQLEKYGYLKRVKISKGRGKWEIEYHLTAVPFSFPSLSLDENTTNVNTSNDITTDDNTLDVKATNNSNIDISNIDLRNKEHSKIDLEIQRSTPENFDQMSSEKFIDALTAEDKRKKVAPKKEKFGEHQNVFLTIEEAEKLYQKFGDNDYAWIINKLSNFKIQNDKKYKSDYGAINNWVIEALLQHKIKNNGSSKHSTVPTRNAFGSIRDKIKREIQGGQPN